MNITLTPIQAHLWKWLGADYRRGDPDFGRGEPWYYSNHQVRVLHRFAFLDYASDQAANKGAITWGAIDWRTGIYGRTGLCQAEALELIYYFGRRDALIDMAPPEDREGLKDWVSNLLRTEVVRVAQERGYRGDLEA